MKKTIALYLTFFLDKYGNGSSDFKVTEIVYIYIYNMCTVCLINVVRYACKVLMAKLFRSVRVRPVSYTHLTSGGITVTSGQFNKLFNRQVKCSIRCVTCNITVGDFLS